MGGEKGASATQLLIEVVNDITSAMEDNRAGVVLSAIDFAKAFNRLDHSHCLGAFAKKGSSTQVLSLLSAFLMGRTMTVRVGKAMSTPRLVNAGAPQGSVLGCFLFNIGIDDLEEYEEENLASQKDTHEETLARTDDFPATSTPVRVRSTNELMESPIQAQPKQDFTLLPRVANAPPWIRKPKDPIYEEGRLHSYKFVDDNVNTSKVNMRKAKLLVEDEVFFKEVTDMRTQRHLEAVSRRARERGMAINADKTSLMLVSAATSFKARTSLKLDGKTISGVDKLKVLGVTIDSDATFRSHTENIAARMRSKTWTLSQLRKKGLSEEKLVRTYKCLIRPTIEYAAPSWHSMITASQAADLERQQTQALKNIYGPTLSANKMRIKSGLDLLSKRREALVSNFAKKDLHNPRCRGWFCQRSPPRYARRTNVNYPRYREETARTDRHRNSPRNYLVRKLNEL